MSWYIKVLNQYFDFSGRARRKEFWMFILISAIISLIMSVIDLSLGLMIADTGILSSLDSSGLTTEYTGILGSLYSLAVFIPSLAVSVRRLHDVGKSGWMLLLMLLPIIGWIWLLILNVREGNGGTNQYGPSPK